MSTYYLTATPSNNRLLRFFLNIDLFLLLLIMAFAAMGMVTLYSASDVFASRFGSQINNWVLTGVTIIVVAQIKPYYLQNLAAPMYLLGVLLLLGVDLFGETRKGATRWLNLGITSIQPSELMKIAVPMALAWWFYQRQRLESFANFAVACVILLIPIALILLEPDLGTAILVCASGLAVVFFAGLSWLFIIPPVLVLVIILTLIVGNQNEWCQEGANWFFLHDYQVKRICTLLNPDADPQGGGFHILQSTIAIGSGGMMGKGFMQGTQTHLNFIPESTTDFIFAVFAEEFGLVGNGILVLCYLLLVWRGLSIAAHATTEFSRLLACGVTSIFFVCAFVNLGMVSGVLPVVGVPLPFMSYGGTALVTFGAGIGILMSIAGESKQKKREQA